MAGYAPSIFGFSHHADPGRHQKLEAEMHEKLGVKVTLGRFWGNKKISGAKKEEERQTMQIFNDFLARFVI